jgi:tetratricopeptide (TPR) repeat protein
MAAVAAMLTVLYAESRPIDPRATELALTGRRGYEWYQASPLPRSELRAALGATERPFKVRVILDANPRRLAMALGGVDILHLSLFARRDQRFAMTNEHGFVDRVSTGRLARLLLNAHRGERLPLLILATPFSDQLAPALRAAGIPTIITVDHDRPMPAAVATTFYTALYGGLADGLAPIEAFRRARRAVARDPLFGDRFHPATPDGIALPPYSHRFRLFLTNEPVPLRPNPLPRGMLAWEEAPLPETVPLPPAIFAIHRRQMAETVAALAAEQGPQLVTIVGDVGTGKSSLAAEAVRWLGLHHHFPGGIRWFRCAEIQPPLARILSPRLGELLESWPDTGDGRRLLVLDGLEVLQATLVGRERVPDLLDATLGRPDLHLLVTARIPLGLEGAEHVIEVGALSPEDARKLFAARAGALASAGWGGTEWAALDDICDLLDYQPLAVSLAAGYISLQKSTLTKLRDTLAEMLEGAYADDDEQEIRELQTPLRALLNLLLSGLDNATRNLFHLLGAFPAGAPPAALDALVGSDRWRAMAESLRAIGLASEEEGGRYFQSDTLRAVSAEGLAPGDWWHLSAWYLQRSLEMHAMLMPAERETLALRLFGQATPQLSPSEELDLRRALDFFDRELPNILAVVQFAGLVRAWTRVADLVERLHLYLRLRALTAEQAWAAEQAVIAAENSGDSERLAQALLNQGEVALVQGRFAEAERTFQESLVMFQGRQDPTPTANVLHNLGTVYLNQNRLAEAEAAFQQSVSLFEEVQDHFHLAAVYHNLGNVYKEDRRWADAERALRQSLASSESIGDQLGLAESLSVLGLVLDYQQQWEEAKLTTERALDIVRTERVPELEAAILWNLGGRLIERGEIIPGLQQLGACIALERSIGHPDAEHDAATLRGLLTEHNIAPSEIDYPLSTDSHPQIFE